MLKSKKYRGDLRRLRESSKCMDDHLTFLAEAAVLSLKHRSSRNVQPVPACPQLVRILRHHLDNYICGPDGRLFVTRTGTQRHPVSGG